MPHANQILVTIAVEDDKLSIFPRREDEATIYYSKKRIEDPNKNPKQPRAHPERPREICWMATGMEKGHTIRIFEDPNYANLRGKPIFGQSQWEIQGSNPAACAESGVAQNGPDPGTYAVWKYAVELLKMVDGTDPVTGESRVIEERLDFIDPTVVIKTDP